jgi:hypothetical protein
MAERREPMTTPGGNSVRTEIDARLEEVRARAFEEAIAFLRLAGHAQAAEDLDRAAFASVPA